MISAKTVAYLEGEEIPYILGARMRKVKEVREEVLSQAGRYREVHPERSSAKDPSPLKVKEVVLDGRRYIVCLNEKPVKAKSSSATRGSGNTPLAISSFKHTLILSTATLNTHGMNTYTSKGTSSHNAF